MDDRGSKLEYQPFDAARSVDSLPGPRPLPLIGNLTQLDPVHFHSMLEDFARQYGPIFKLRIMNSVFVATARREDVSHMLHDRPDLWRRTERTNLLEELGARGLFTAEGQEWRRQRKLVMHALTPEVIHRFFPQMVRLTERLQRRWMKAVEEGREPDILRDLKAFTLDVTVGLAMGQDLNVLENESDPLQRDVEFLFTRLARRLTTPVPYWRVFRLPVDRETDAAVARVRHAVAGFVARARERLAAVPARREKPADMLEAMVIDRDTPGSGMTDEDLIGNAVLMVFAGEDTTSNTIAWLLHLLSSAPSAWEKLAEEAKEALGADTVLREFRALDKLPWLDLCTREAMRLKPVAPMLGFEPTQDLVLGDVRLPAGILVFALMRHAFTLDTQLERSDEFLPERWLSEPGQEQDDPSRKLLPFGGGPRFCPGRYLAMTEIRMVVSMLARCFTLAPKSGAPPVDEVYTFTMTPSALPVLLQRRTL
ncbi:cytochrome P450 [Pseudoduganella sp. UC29_106]|uniref:cytochrome P450 n=1 Tax=Pseudoduganella sp. UC29_106 TaxID=3374553 RepID=UPI003756F722